MSSLSEMPAADWQRFFERQRWYADKGRELVAVDTSGEAAWTLAQLRFRDGGERRYQLLAPSASPEDVAEDPGADDFWLELGRAVRLGRVDAAGGRVELHTAPGVEPVVVARELESSTRHVLRGEMSNTLVRVGEKLMVKVYRRIVPGVHPEVEALQILTERGFRHVPSLVAVARLEGGLAWGDGAALLVIIENVATASDLWRVFSDPEFDPRLDLRALAVELGGVTAAMHRVFHDAFHDAGDTQSPPDSGPERRFDFEEDLRVLDRLETERSRLPGTIRPLLTDVLSRRGEIEARLAGEPSGSAPWIRTHGDLHLGQFLWRASDGRLVVTDFEGEPAREPGSRRTVWPAARDVACLLRSFAYARFVSRRGRDWEEQLRESYLDAYRTHTRGEPFAGTEPVFTELVALFELQKALDETLYELTHRLFWLEVPLRGVLEILED